MGEERYKGFAPFQEMLASGELEAHKTILEVGENGTTIHYLFTGEGVLMEMYHRDGGKLFLTDPTESILSEERAPEGWRILPGLDLTKHL
ncbi:MAG: hypothetical protein ABIJ18_04695 [archaeon]